MKRKLICKKCKKKIDHPRRGMCLNCYRKVTGLSKSKPKSKIKPILPIFEDDLEEDDVWLEDDEEK